MFFLNQALQAAKEEPTVKVEASKFFPGLPDPRKTWEIYQQVSIT